MSILKQREWTRTALLAAGFVQYSRKRSVVMARVLQASEAPKRIKSEWDTLVALEGYLICYDVGDGKRKKSLDAYSQWPVEPQIFLKTYRKWDDKSPWTPNAGEKHLLENGCKPYYKFAGVWAKRLKEPMKIQSLEGVEPIEVPAGGWVTIGVQGEPVSMSHENFTRRYELLKAERAGIIERILSRLMGN